MNKLHLKQLAVDWKESGIVGLISDHKEATDGSVFTYFAYTYKKIGRSFLITPPLSPFGYESVPQGSEAALHQFLDFLDKNHSKSYIHIVLNADSQSKSVLKDRGFETSEKPNFTLDLSAHLDDIKRGLSSTRKRQINKSERELTLVTDSNRDQIFDLFRDTYRKNGLSIPEVFFEKLESRETGHEQILSAVYQGENLLAANLCVKSGDVAYYLLGGVNAKFKMAHPGTYSLWTCILAAREMGAKNFDFCGSAVPGIARFFKSFGAVENRYLEIKKGHKGVDFVKKMKSKFVN